MFIPLYKSSKNNHLMILYPPPPLRKFKKMSSTTTGLLWTLCWTWNTYCYEVLPTFPSSCCTKENYPSHLFFSKDLLQQNRYKYIQGGPKQQGWTGLPVGIFTLAWTCSDGNPFIPMISGSVDALRDQWRRAGVRNNHTVYN